MINDPFPQNDDLNVIKMHGNKECPSSGVTSSGRVWRKVAGKRGGWECGAPFKWRNQFWHRGVECRRERPGSVECVCAHICPVSSVTGCGRVWRKGCSERKRILEWVRVLDVAAFVDAEVESTCTCGAAGTCDGGVNEQCNCDTSGSVKTVDENLIISNKRLPICEVSVYMYKLLSEGAGVPIPNRPPRLLGH